MEKIIIEAKSGMFNGNVDFPDFTFADIDVVEPATRLLESMRLAGISALQLTIAGDFEAVVKKYEL